MTSIVIKEMTRAKAADDVLCATCYTSSFLPHLLQPRYKKNLSPIFQLRKRSQRKSHIPRANRLCSELLCSSPHSTAFINKRKKDTFSFYHMSSRAGLDKPGPELKCPARHFCMVCKLKVNGFCILQLLGGKKSCNVKIL